jgi:hypothetical protein
MDAFLTMASRGGSGCLKPGVALLVTLNCPCGRSSKDYDRERRLGLDAEGPVRVIDEHQNFGRKGGVLRVELSPARTLASQLSLESDRRWHEPEAQRYLELGLDPEYHANWGIG